MAGLDPRWLAAVVVLLMPVSSSAALNAYLKLKGQKAGELAGVARVVSVEEAPAPEPTGKSVGQRAHQPLKLQLEVEPNSALLVGMGKGARLSAVEIEVRGQDPYTVSISDVVVKSQEPAADGTVKVELEAAAARNLGPLKMALPPKLGK